ncbi:tRNA lysidine(34) synthetase TilS [Planococcus shenhongbingii]|uniref:tRNA(Ile)-lysidine synthase n=1 Tax=Planococcus shenhongbingii TaxID=3058398 RepID=A0ABT8NI28_9BACL|nr:tRNA lysidine(34) synthetase TilS [Planococcus sp. N017]MDN7247559.1 tRNA lysidine(34) synthetase TilS [Planococcus sp. N017]
MKTFHKKMMEYIKKHRLLVPGDRVLAGCSGGIDSLVLLHFLKTNEDYLGVSVHGVHVNHMLRGEESRQDRLFTEGICRQWKIPCHSQDIPIPEILVARGGNKQQVCREQRYAYFEEVMWQTEAGKFVTAHHADDQLETILMSGIRGTLQFGSFGIPVRRSFGKGELIRPLLAVTREEIEQYAKENGLVHREDSSNAEKVYTRNRVRQTIIPLLKMENNTVSEQFAELAETMQQDQQFLMDLAGEKVKQIIRFEETGISLSAKSFSREALALQKRMVLILLNYLYNERQVEITKQLVEQVQEMMQSSAGTVFLHLPQNCMIVRQYDSVLLSMKPIGEAAVKNVSIVSNEWSKEMNGFRYKAVPLSQAKLEKNSRFWYFSASEKMKLLVRNRKPGDRIQLAGMERSKKVARLMIDEKVPVPLRKDWPVIAAENDEVLFLPGLRPSNFFSRIKRDEDNWVLIEQKV